MSVANLSVSIQPGRSSALIENDFKSSLAGSEAFGLVTMGVAGCTASPPPNFEEPSTPDGVTTNVSNTVRSNQRMAGRDRLVERERSALFSRHRTELVRGTTCRHEGKTGRA